MPTSFDVWFCELNLMLRAHDLLGLRCFVQVNDLEVLGILRLLGLLQVGLLELLTGHDFRLGCVQT